MHLICISHDDVGFKSIFDERHASRVACRRRSSLRRSETISRVAASQLACVLERRELHRIVLYLSSKMNSKLLLFVLHICTCEVLITDTTKW